MSSIPLKIKQVAGGEKNATFQIRGWVSKEDMPKTPVQVAQGLKLSSILWVIQEKLTLYLWWDKEELLLPMESRHSCRFDHNLQPPEGWNGTMYLSSLNWNQPNPIGKTFLVVLDFDR